jgi:predicted HTH transcriptional regulator
MASRSKGLYEEFARFFEKPTREGLRELLKKNVGELQHCDFKVQWPALPKLSRILLGIANSGGGCVIIGVAENEDNESSNSLFWF